jgi:hypothetical protein
MAIVPGTDTNKIQCNTENMGELEVHETTRDDVRATSFFMARLKVKEVI